MAPVDLFQPDLPTVGLMGSGVLASPLGAGSERLKP